MTDSLASQSLLEAIQEKLNNLGNNNGDCDSISSIQNSNINALIEKMNNLVIPEGLYERIVALNLKLNELTNYVARVNLFSIEADIVIESFKNLESEYLQAYTQYLNLKIPIEALDKSVQTLAELTGITNIPQMPQIIDFDQDVRHLSDIFSI